MQQTRLGDSRNDPITPLSVYTNRRRFLKGVLWPLAASALGEHLIAFLSPLEALPALPLPLRRSTYSTGEAATGIQDVTTYNNFYEFGTGKGDPSRNAGGLPTDPWTVRVDGEVQHPMSLSLKDLMAMAPMEERIYRHRCVEGWSMVVPWAGFSLSHLIQSARPTPAARFVAFESYYDPSVMPEARWAGIAFPYREGLRLDEAMHPLTLLCFGMYGRPLPNQDGAPVRLIVPWKYGFKSIKSLVSIRFVRQQPPTTWSLSSPDEYGFYANVNPGVDHPRWSQKRERRLGEFLKRETLVFNGYSDSVARLYTGMDLRKNF